MNYTYKTTHYYPRTKLKEVGRISTTTSGHIGDDDIQCVAKNRMETNKRTKSRGPFPYSQDQAAQIESAIMAYRHMWNAHNISFILKVQVVNS